MSAPIGYSLPIVCAAHAPVPNVQACRAGASVPSPASRVSPGGGASQSAEAAAATSSVPLSTAPLSCSLGGVAAVDPQADASVIMPKIEASTATASALDRRKKGVPPA